MTCVCPTEPRDIRGALPIAMYVARHNQFLKEADQVGCWVVCLCAGLKGLHTNKQDNKTPHGFSVGKLINAMLYRTYCTGTVHSAQMLCVAKPSLNS